MCLFFLCQHSFQFYSICRRSDSSSIKLKLMTKRKRCYLLIQRPSDVDAHSKFLSRRLIFNNNNQYDKIDQAFRPQKPYTSSGTGLMGCNKLSPSKYRIESFLFLLFYFPEHVIEVRDRTSTFEVPAHQTSTGFHNLYKLTPCVCLSLFFLTQFFIVIIFYSYVNSSNELATAKFG